MLDGLHLRELEQQEHGVLAPLVDRDRAIVVPLGDPGRASVERIDRLVHRCDYLGITGVKAVTAVPQGLDTSLEVAAHER